MSHERPYGWLVDELRQLATNGDPRGTLETAARVIETYAPRAAEGDAVNSWLAGTESRSQLALVIGYLRRVDGGK